MHFPLLQPPPQIHGKGTLELELVPSLRKLRPPAANPARQPVSPLSSPAEGATGRESLPSTFGVSPLPSVYERPTHAPPLSPTFVV